MRFKALVLVLLTACSSCDEAEGETQTPPVGSESAEAILLETEGTLQGGGSSQDFEVQVQAGDQLVVQVRSTAFDPILAVQPPAGAVLSNDDWEGSREESRVNAAAPAAGAMKITVTSFNPSASGAFTLVVRSNGGGAGAATPAPSATATTLMVGQPVEGALAPGDVTLSDGRLSDHYVVQGVAGTSLELLIDAMTEQVPNAIVVSPTGHMLAAAANGRYAIVEPGPHRVQLVSGQPGQQAGYRIAVQAASGPATPTLSRSHHQLPQAVGGSPLALGQSVRGQFAPGSSTLPTGEPMMVYLLPGTQGQPVHLEMTASAFDAYLMVISPSGQHWENDDADGGTDSSLDFTMPETGNYRVVATAYRADMAGEFEIKTSRERPAPAVAAAATLANPNPAAAGEQIQVGTLAAGDSTLNSGEFHDVYPVELTAGEHVRFEARSTGFDTYLIVRPPTGDQTDNDDMAQGNTNAGIDYVVSAGGTHQVTVTSYSPGETGAYQFVTRRSGGTAAPSVATNSAAATQAGDRETGSLSASDDRLSSGEFTDRFTRSFTPGQSVSVRLESSAFDAYLISVSPSGHQTDNDDIVAGNTNSGLEIVAAEPGPYTFTVTSYSPGETGAYSLAFGAGAARPQANTNVATNGINGAAAANPGGARIFGLFAGISDYPPGVGDLPECANDAVKLAEALRNHGLLDPSRQVLLTDAQATRANVLGAMQRFSAEMQPNDVFVFFYSGHGGQTRTSQDPREIDGTDEFLVLHDGQLLDNELAVAFNDVRAGTSVIALDACYSGGFAKDLITRPGRVGLFSSEEDVLSAVAGQFQAGGYLSHFFRTAVSGEADVSPNDRVLTVGELTHFLYTQFGTHATDVQLQGAYQHLVVDRGAVRVDQVLWAY